MRIEGLKFDDYVPARIKRKSLGSVAFLRIKVDQLHRVRVDIIQRLLLQIPMMTRMGMINPIMLLLYHQSKQI